MKILKKLSLTMLFVISVLFLVPSTANAASVGQVLTNPEAGWQRIDDIDSNINYSSSWLDTVSEYGNAKRWGGTGKYCTGGNESIMTFKFYGTKLRLIGELFTNRANDNIIIIDNVPYNFNSYGTETYRALVYEKSDLELGIHTVVIKSSSSMTSSQYLILDAIDIDDTGYLIPFSQTSNLTATAGDTAINLTWIATEGAISYNVKRATTSGGPYTTIATTTEKTYEDTGLINGTTYYYVITAIDTGIESSNSNEASATPIAVVTGNSAMLILTMTNGNIKEYSVNATELDVFLTWYDTYSNGSGKSYYIFTKKNNISPYVSRKEYIAFDKISSFVVNEYND